jgi:hypothetical protein
MAAAWVALVPTPCHAQQTNTGGVDAGKAMKQVVEESTRETDDAEPATPKSTDPGKNALYVFKDYFGRTSQDDAVFAKTSDNIKRLNDLLKELAGTPVSEFDVGKALPDVWRSYNRLEKETAFGNPDEMKQAAESFNRAAEAVIPLLHCHTERLAGNLEKECQ